MEPHFAGFVDVSVGMFRSYMMVLLVAFLLAVAFQHFVAPPTGRTKSLDIPKVILRIVNQGSGQKGLGLAQLRMVQWLIMCNYGLLICV